MSSPRLYPFVATACRDARVPRVAVTLLVLLACTACTPPPDTPTDKPTEPQATQMRDAMQKPLDRAHAAQQTLDDNAVRQREAIENAGG